MDVFRLCLLLCCGVACAHAAATGGSPEQVARLLRLVRLTPERAALVPTVLRDVEYALQSGFPGCRAELFGSIAAGLGMAESDLDTAIIFKPNDTTTNLSPSQLVLEARTIMLQHPDFFKIIKIAPLATVPIVSVTHLPTGFMVDISFNNFNGIQNSKLIRHVISIDERAKDLALILKCWGKLERIIGPTMLPSYGVVTMAIFFLQQKDILPPVSFLQRNAEKYFVNNWNNGFTREKYETRNDESLCDLLGGFFSHYSNFVNSNYMVSPYVGRLVEIDLFRDVNTVPAEFDIYKINVHLNITPPLALEKPLIQDIFRHNLNLAYRVTDVDRRQIVEKSFQNAMQMFQEGCIGFLEAIYRRQLQSVAGR